MVGMGRKLTHILTTVVTLVLLFAQSVLCEPRDGVNLSGPGNDCHQMPDLKLR